jgi:hypothetical protein
MSVEAILMRRTRERRSGQRTEINYYVCAMYVYTMYVYTMYVYHVCIPCTEVVPFEKNKKKIKKKLNNNNNCRAIVEAIRAKESCQTCV